MCHSHHRMARILEGRGAEVTETSTVSSTGSFKVNLLHTVTWSTKDNHEIYKSQLNPSWNTLCRTVQLGSWVDGRRRTATPYSSACSQPPKLRITDSSLEAIIFSPQITINCTLSLRTFVGLFPSKASTKSSCRWDLKYARGLQHQHLQDLILAVCDYGRKLPPLLYT